jgi:hypothetical protein
MWLDRSFSGVGEVFPPISDLKASVLCCILCQLYKRGDLRVKQPTYGEGAAEYGEFNVVVLSGLPHGLGLLKFGVPGGDSACKSDNVLLPLLRLNDNGGLGKPIKLSGRLGSTSRRVSWLSPPTSDTESIEGWRCMYGWLL